jgi:hypothetical protein
MKTSVEIMFDNVVNQGFDKILEPLGFKKRGNNFYAQYNGIGHLVNIQKSIHSSGDHIAFTVNAAIFLPEFWLVFYNFFNKSIPPEYPREPECILRVRIGDLIKDNDVWYDLHRSTCEEKLIKEMKINVKQFILPYFGRALSKEMLVDLMDDDASEIESFEKLIAFMVLGEKERAKKEYKVLLEDFIRHSHSLERIKEFGKRYGLV